MKANGMLLFGDADTFPIVPSRQALEANLRTLRPNVLVTNLNGPTFPADLSAYGTIWFVGAFSAISASAADQTRLTQFLANGGRLYLTGERQCCQALNSSVQNLLRAVVVGGSGIVVGTPRDFFSPPGDPLLPVAGFNRTARGGVTTMPNALTSWVPNAPGEIRNISGGNILATIDAGDVPGIVAGVWNEGDLRGNAGRIVLMMDVDWLSDQASLAQCDAVCRQAIIENFVVFLDDPAQPDPEPSAVQVRRRNSRHAWGASSICPTWRSRTRRSTRCSGSAAACSGPPASSRA